MIAAIRNYFRKNVLQQDKPSAVAYDAWSGFYDDQPGNLMLDLDEQLFTLLLQNIDLQNKKIADIGCGTGRHWQKLYAMRPALISGFDVSEGMLKKLKQKYPDAMTQLITDDFVNMVPDAFADCVVTTLTIAHIKNIDEAIAAWARITNKNGYLIITDFHPAILAKGGKRSFKYQGKSMSVINYVHPLKKVIAVCQANGFSIMRQEERYINAEVKHYYENQDALHVYDRFKGMPVIYGLVLKKEHAAA